VRISVSSTSHRRSWPSFGAPAATGPLASKNRLIRRLSRTGLQPAGSPLSGRRPLYVRNYRYAMTYSGTP